MNGFLIPMMGGDPIPLLKMKIRIGRREDSDICLPFPNVSGKHCELVFLEGTWLVRDLASTNGVKVNGMRVEKKRLNPGDELVISRKHFYRIQYDRSGYGAFVEDEDEEEDIMSKPLLERAGLQQKPKSVELDSDLEDERPTSRGKRGR